MAKTDFSPFSLGSERPTNHQSGSAFPFPPVLSVCLVWSLLAGGTWLSTSFPLPPPFIHLGYLFLFESNSIREKGGQRENLMNNGKD